MYTRFRTKLQEREEGFTLIELLVVIIIIGILAAIAIPVFLNQREKAWQKSVDSDARNAIVPLETNFGDANTYATDISANMVASKDNSVTIYGTATTYCVVAVGNGKTAYVTNSSGGVLELATAANVAAALVLAKAADGGECDAAQTSQKVG